jgi:cell division protease FtsH
VHLKKLPLASDVEPSVIARGTPGFSGADLANMVNEAALLAARRGKRVVGMEELEESKDKVMMGAERRSMVMNEEEKKMTAYHEAGHAIVAINIPECDPIHKATIIPRGGALGMVMRLPLSDAYSVSKSKLEADIAVAAGGRIAEEMTFGPEKITTGASSDIEQATRIARKMIVEWGMSDKLGFLSYAEEGTHGVFLGHSTSSNKGMSDDTAQIIEAEIKDIVDRSYRRAENILKSNIEALELLAQGLLEHETLDGSEIKRIVEGQKIEKQKKIPHTPLSKKHKMPVSSDLAHKPARPTSKTKNGKPKTAGAEKHTATTEKKTKKK